MRWIAAVVVCVGVLIFEVGCTHRDASPDVRPSGAPTTAKSDFAVRFEAASTINDLNRKDETLARLADDASAGGNAEIAKKSIDGIQSVSVHDATAFASAILLATAGKGKEAVTIAQSINSVTKRDEALAEIAKNASSK